MKQIDETVLVYKEKPTVVTQLIISESCLYFYAQTSGTNSRVFIFPYTKT
jgi:hypothetical protein